MLRFDVVILHGLWLYPAHALSQLAKRLGDAMPPYCVYPHGMLDPWFQRAPERRLKAIRNWFYWKLIERHVIGRAAAVLFTCAEEMRLAQGTFWPYRPRRQMNVGLGVNASPGFLGRMSAAFAEKCPGLNGRPYLLFLSRIHPKKGVDLLIKAYSAVHGGAKSSSQSPVGSGSPALVIAGPGLETEYGKAIQKLAVELCPPDSVLFPGMLTGDAKWGGFYGCEAFVLSSHQENFGIAVAEALACGKPVLISNQINIWREIAEDHAGLVEADTEAGTQTLLQRWKALSAADKAAFQPEAKACFESRFGVAKAAKTLSATLSELTGK